jgi:hypothetical protein
MKWILWSRRLLAAAALTAISWGCAGPDGRSPAPARPRWQSRGSTLGSDLMQAPRGITIPPPSLGVDMVSKPGGSAVGAVQRAVLPVKSE